MNVLTPAAWARTHLGENVLKQAAHEWHIIDTNTGIVVGRQSVNVAVDVTEDGWWLRLYAVTVASRLLIDEWQLPAIHVPEGFLSLLERVSEYA